jgi:hypothetical protein
MGKLLWWLMGERRILATTLPQYRTIGQLVRIADRCYRVTRVAGDEVWGRPVTAVGVEGEVLVVESPLKHLRQLNTQG